MAEPKIHPILLASKNYDFADRYEHFFPLKNKVDLYHIESIILSDTDLKCKLAEIWSDLYNTDSVNKCYDVFDDKLNNAISSATEVKNISSKNKGMDDCKATMLGSAKKIKLQ
ncbi:Hypothetical protein CINCED_3A024810 [Cinara cedri]|uniref:Uncharacterized protein n=1 Tax=Cinara cedri TaxID=506608 RepID=A0A5E4MPW9_9HEMI|nr:Hypothetical protein CINCED_3A024810 [Cinara cedri]